MITAPVTSLVTLTNCEDTTNNGTNWFAGVVGGALPNFTCTGSPTGLSGSLTINVQATNASGTGTGTSVARTVDVTGPTDGTLTVTPGDTVNGLAGRRQPTAAAACTLRQPTTFGSSRAARHQRRVRPELHWARRRRRPLTIHRLPIGTQYSYRVCAYDARTLRPVRPVRVPPRLFQR